MPGPDLNIIVCVDKRRCMTAESYGRNSAALLAGLRRSVREHGLEGRIQVTRCYCIFGCTYGPRIDVSRRWCGDKVLYGTKEGEVTISVRGTVKMLKVPEDLLELVLDNLPERKLPHPDEH